MFENCCIITFGVGSWYVEGVERMKESLKLVGYDGGFHTRQDYPPGCPTEQEVRKAYKPYLMKEAQDKGYTQLLWLDASVWAIRPLDKLFDMIQRVGWFLIDDGWNTGQWTCDSALEPLGITRDESWDIWHLASGLVGLNLENERASTFLSEWHRIANDGISFVGPRWSPHVKQPGQGDVGFCSTDDRVHGHRADQTAASVISWKQGMLPTHKTSRFCPATWVLKDIPDNKCLIVRGGVRPDDLKGVPYG